MAKENRQNAVMPYKGRPGEGTVVDVVIQHVAGQDPATVTMGVNLTTVPVPDRRYVADCVAVEVRNNQVSVLFGQEKVGRTGALRSLIDLKMGPDGISMLVNVVRSMQGLTINELFAMGKAPSESLRVIEDEPDQTVAFAANMVNASFTTHQACFDFYQASAATIAQARFTKKIAIDPVVRVEVRLALAIALVDELERVSANLLALH